MSEKQRNLDRFTELLNLGKRVLQTKFRVNAREFSHDSVDISLSSQWGIKCLTTLEKVYGKSNRYFTEFNSEFEGFDSIAGYSCAKTAFAILEAAKEDYEDGYVINHLQENNIKIPEASNTTINLASKCDKEAERNTKIYLVIIFELLTLISLPFFYFLGVKYASIFTLMILIISYLLSALSLKEWTPTKLHERILEIEKDRIYKNFDINQE
jgi:hypothetical protein